MKGKTLWGIIFGLVVTNCLTIALLLNNGKTSIATSSNEAATQSETVAQIGDEVINRQEWLAELENRFGKTTLENMINKKVVEELAKKYDIEVPEKVIDRELMMFKATYNAFGEEGIQEEENWREQIRYSILLEELLTKDVDVSEEEMRQYFDANKQYYQIDTSYHLSHIVVKTKEEVSQILKELDEGSSFEALAAERSIDEITAANGGDLGYVSENSNNYTPKKYVEEAGKLKKGEWSNAIQIDDQYAIILLHEKLDGVAYRYEDVRDQIRRQLALEQMEGNVTTKKLWEEIGVTWFYGNQD
ncbi:peptidyl-prolyl cis-trans isomerase [Bacillus sp. FJAT-47783]|uniref:peptidyl-prolyl cis-trans isomerase n=1 Tax=Bacillus sp. FJAT-47783 TaxID=2922712 RepID=UPI001FABE66A